MMRFLSSLVFAAALVAQTQAVPSPDDQILKAAIDAQQSGSINAAIGGYEKYLAAHPDTFVALANLGAAYAKVGRYTDAIARYKSALKLRPSSPQVEMNLALAWYKIGEAENAAPIFEKVHHQAPDQLQATLLLADCWLAMGKNKQVVELLDPVAIRLPDDLGVTYVLGTALVREKILRNGDSAEAHLLLGTTKLNGSDFSGALEDLKKAVALNPKLPDLYSFYGVALMRTGDTKGAAEAFRTELAANSNDFTSNLQLGALLKMDENYDEALPFLRRALEVRPGDLGVRYQLASIAFDKGDSEQACSQLESIVKESPDFTEAHVTLATVYYRLKRKADGDRERAIVQKLNAEAQEKQPGVNVK
jgi:tetratricopeptide (TPR) repeat protein